MKNYISTTQKCLTLILLISLSFQTFGQKSIEQDLLKLASCKTADDSIKIYKEISRKAINESSPEDGIKYNSDFLSLAKRLGDFKNVTLAQMYISEFYMKMNKFDEAFENGMNAIKSSEKSKDLGSNLRAYNQLGRIYHHFGKFQEAIGTYSKGISIAHKAKLDTTNKAMSALNLLYSNISIAYGASGSKEEQIRSLKKSLEISEKYGDFQKKSFSKYDLAYNLMENGRYKEAEKYFLESIKDSANFELNTYYYANHHGLGINYSRWGEYEKAKKHNYIALAHYRKIGDKLYEGDVLNNLASLYYRLENADSTIKYAREAIFVGKELNHSGLIAGAATNLLQGQLMDNRSTAEIKEALKILDAHVGSIKNNYLAMATYWQALSLVEERNGNFKRALESQKKHTLYVDSIALERQDAKIEQLSIEYETEKKEQEIKELNEENLLKQKQVEQQSKNTRNLIIGLVLIASLLGFTYYLYRKTANQKDYIAQLQKELHHRIKNNLAIISSFIDVALAKASDITTQEALMDLQNRIGSINEVHKLLVSSPSDIGMVDVREYIENLFGNIRKTLGGGQKNLKLDIPDGLMLAQSEVFPLGVIINEFLTNSIKHNPGSDNEIWLNLKQNGRNIRLYLNDLNANVKPDFDFSNSANYGLRLINLLAKQMGGEAIWMIENGLRLNINFQSL